MYQDVFIKYFVSEQELKEVIYAALKGLNIFSPDKWTLDLISYADPKKQSVEIIYDLLNTIPEIEKYREVIAESDVLMSLRAIAIELDMLLNFERFNYLTLELIYTNFVNIFILARYNFAVEFKREELGESPLHNVDLVNQWLAKSPPNAQDMTNILIAAEAAIEEVTVLQQNENVGADFGNLLFKYESEIEEYIKKSIPGIFGLNFFRIAYEAIAKSSTVLGKYNVPDGIVISDLREFSKAFSKTETKIRNDRLGIKRGGARKRKGFVWTNENKVEFYKTVVELPKINGKPMWEYALLELTDKDFSFYIQEYLKIKTPFKTIPQTLFKKAIQTWKKYNVELINIKPQDKPKAFEYQHALYLLKYPALTHSTSEKYFREGKKLAALDK